MSEDADDMLEIDGAEVSLADIAGLDMDDVEEVRGFTFPVCLADWEIEAAELTTRKTKDGVVAVVPFKLKCLNIDVIAEGKDAEAFIGKNFNETFWLKDMAEDLGRVKAFLTDAGFTGTGTLNELLEQCIGTEFKAKITNKASKDDKDVIYANLDRRSITPIGGDEEAGEEATAE